VKKPFLHARGRGWGEGVVRIAGAVAGVQLVTGITLGLYP
jgi:hypothetical protein